MTELVHHLPLDKRVKLKGECTGVYQFARAGAEGWIRNQNFDPVGNFPMVYIQWDRDHWAYNGQEDIWTFENHFELVEEKDRQVSDQQPSKQDIERAVSVFTKLFNLDEEEGEQRALPAAPEDDEGDVAFEATSPEDYERVLKNALKVALGSEAFIVVTVKHEPNPFRENSPPAMVPQIFKAELSEDASVLLGAQLSEIANLFHRELAVERIESITDEKG